MRRPKSREAILVTGSSEGAECGYYRDLFDMVVLFREGTADGSYGRLPDGLDWEIAIRHGVDPGMSFLRRDEFVIALADDPDAGEPTRFDHISLATDLADIGPIASRAASMGCGVDERETSAIITDQYGVEWELSATGFPPSSPFDTLEF